jgi:kynurenine 3-monooxygenase
MPSVFISGGGPSGLAAALLFEQLGWDEIVVAERRAGPEDFEKNKSFNYLIDPRGQRLLGQIGLLDQLPEHGVATTVFKAVVVAANGTAKTITAPTIDPDRPVCYWTTRRVLLNMLCKAILDRASPRIHLLYRHKVAGIARLESGRAQIRVIGPDGAERHFTPDLVLACDGLNSAVRAALEQQSEVPAGHFAMLKSPSLSAGLRYKVLNLPARFAAANGQVAIDDNQMGYIMPSRHKDRRKACALFAFPVVSPDHPRSVNLIREADHDLWTISDPDALLAFLADAFPQLDIPALVPRGEAEDFVGMEAGSFPEPQHAANLHASIGPAAAPTQFLLIGDAAHAFPPDLGLGVNSALQDLTLLAEHLQAARPLADNVAAYAAERLPETRDLVWMVANTFPEQYGHRAWRLRFWLAGFLLRKLLHRLAPAIFDKPANYLSQDPVMTYGEMRRRTVRTTARLRLLGGAMLSLLLLGWLIN